MECQHAVRGQQRQARTVQDGFTVTVFRKADRNLSADACVVEVRDPSSRVVFTGEGYNTGIHDYTGRDVDNDGTPDIIVGHDSQDTGQCCSDYTVVALGPTPHAAGEFSNVWFEADGNRRTLAWHLVPMADLAVDFGPTPMLVVVDQYREGRFVDVTSEYCPTILAGTARGMGSLSDDLWRLEGSNLTASRNETGTPSFEVETTRGSATLVAAQMMYCGRDAQARDLIARAWPDAAQDSIRSTIAAAVAAARRR